MKNQENRASANWTDQIRDLAILAIGLTALSLLPQAVNAADQNLERARTAANEGNAIEMEAAFREVLKRDPNNEEALLGIGTALAWQGKHSESQGVYKRILDRDSKHRSALVGLGYSYAWNMQYPLARQTFDAALQIDQQNPEAIKGLGYTYLWEGNYEQSVTQFSLLTNDQNVDPEAEVALGQAELGMGRPKASTVHFHRALDDEPRRQDARDGLRAARSKPTPIEASLWFGNTSNGGDTGLRYAELATWATPTIRAWLSYDNSLSLDNPALVRLGEDAETYRVGLSSQFGKNWINLIEIGHRSLPRGEDQLIYKFEAALVSSSPAWKLGLQISPHSLGYDDTLIYSGLNFALAERIRLEPTIYIAQSGALKDDEWRLVLGTNYQSLKGWDAYGALGYGRIQSVVPVAEGSVQAATAKVSFPLRGLHTLLLSLNYENSPSNEFVVVMLGVSLKF